MGGGQQSSGNAALDQYMQQQQYKELGNTLTKSLQGAGSLVANANAGLSGQVAGSGQAPMLQPQSGYGQGPSYGATGGLFSQGGMGGGIDEQQLAQILRLLGYGG
jgi:hypothetical protein